MKINAKITGIKYQHVFISELKTFDLDDVDINDLPSSCKVNYNDFTVGLSRWVSPKRTRSYPYERVYNTFGTSKRITIIPIIKDEGKEGDRDYIQWDTVSLMSLLDVYVIFSYYNSAERHKTRENKITNQRLDNDQIKQKIKEIKSYHSSALHWNLEEIEESMPELINKVKTSYQEIGRSLGIEFHGERGIENFKDKFMSGVEEFKKFSRSKAEEAQQREAQTVHTAEFLSSDTKSVITIENYLGGQYYFTVDEIMIKDENIYLIESKHSRTATLPSPGDIKDGLLTMILFTNFEDVEVNGNTYTPVPVLKLTSSKINGRLTNDDKITDFESYDNLSKVQRENIKKLIEEANRNNFKLIIEGVE